MTVHDETDQNPETTADSLAGQPGGMAQTPSAIGGSDEDDRAGGDPLASTTGDAGTGQPGTDVDGGVDQSDADRGNLDGSTAGEDVRERSLDESKDSSSYTDSGEAGADNGLSE